ncbi:hypothetical protein CW368_04490 [Actinomycetales bacterium SN12]|nr:hypothetical protein CW368_04490 [Actinomycetales bacterium SN12]
MDADMQALFRAMVLRDALDGERQDLPNVSNDVAWAPTPAVIVEHVLPSPITDWLADAPAAFDTAHESTARLVVTNRGVSPTILHDFTFGDLTRSVPMGYTDLGVVEKRAVISGGRVVRIWPPAFEPAEDEHGWTLFIPDDEAPAGRGSPLSIATSSVLWHGLDLGCRLSRLMGGRPALLVRNLESHYWH